MSVLAAGVDAQFLEHLSAEGGLGEHTLDRLVDGEFGLLAHKFLVLNLFETADVTGVIAIVFLLQFSAGEHNLIAVDDYNVVATVDVGSVLGLVFSFEYARNLRGKSAEDGRLPHKTVVLKRQSQSVKTPITGFEASYPAVLIKPVIGRIQQPAVADKGAQ